MIFEHNRPCTDSNGKRIEDGDLIGICFQKVKVFAVIDDKLENKIIPHRDKDVVGVTKLICMEWHKKFGNGDKVIKIDPDEDIDEGGFEWGG